MQINKRTPLYKKHLALGARMVSFSGWDMPVQYTEGILAEHRHTRKAVSIFDISHMGEFRVSGKNSAEYLDKIFARSVITQKPGSCRYNFLLTDNAGIIDDLIIYRIGEEEFFIVVNAGTKDGDAEHLMKVLPGELKFADESDETVKIDLQGPASVEVLEDLGLEKEALPSYYHWVKTEISNIRCLLSRTGYTGEPGFEIYTASENGTSLWDILIKQKNVSPAGLGARDTLRLEMGYPLYGHELDLETTPVEAGFGPMLKLEDNRSFPGAGVLRNSQPKKNLVGIELEGRQSARKDAEIYSNGEKIGKVSSGTFSPSLEKAIALGYIDCPFQVKCGTSVELSAGKKLIAGKIADLPFYKKI